MDPVQNIALAALNIAKHIHDEQYGGIIVSGASNQLSRSLFTSAWMAQYPEEALPKIHALDAKVNRMFYATDYTTAENKILVEEWIDEHLPELNELKHEKLCFVDDFGATGQKIHDVADVFRELGFTHVDFNLFAASEKTELDERVFVGEYSDEAVEELQTMAMNIQEQPSIKEIIGHIELTGEQRRLRTLEELREIGREMRRG